MALPKIVTAVISPKPIVVATLKQYHILSKMLFIFGSIIHTPTLTQAKMIMYVVKNFNAPVRFSTIFISRVFFIIPPPALFNKIISILPDLVNKIKNTIFICPEYKSFAFALLRYPTDDSLNHHNKKVRPLKVGL